MQQRRLSVPTFSMVVKWHEFSSTTSVPITLVCLGKPTLMCPVNVDESANRMYL